MSQKFSSKEHGIELVMPLPFTGLDWANYQKAYRAHSEQGHIIAAFKAVLAVAESVAYEGGDMKETGLSAPLEAVAWVARAGDDYVNEKLTIPKN